MNKLLTALRAASAALTELDPMGEHHDAALIDDALKLETVDIVVEMGEGDIYNIVTNTPGVRIAVIDRFSFPEADSDMYSLPVWGDEPGTVDEHIGYRAAEPNVDPDYVATVIAAIGESHE